MELAYRYLNYGSVTDTIDCIGGCSADSYKFSNLSSNDIMLGMRWKFPVDSGFVTSAPVMMQPPGTDDAVAPAIPAATAAISAEHPRLIDLATREEAQTARATAPFSFSPPPTANHFSTVPPGRARRRRRASRRRSWPGLAAGPHRPG